MPGRETAFERALAEHRKSGYGPFDALERLAPESAKCERVADEAAGRLGNDAHPGLGAALQSRCQARRVADCCLFLRRAVSHEITDDDKAGGDANTGHEGFARG